MTRIGSAPCFFPTFPRALGGANDGTSFRTIDVNSDGNFVVGGDSKDTVLCNTGSSPVPVVAMYLIDGLLLWSKQIAGGTYEHVEAVKFRGDFSKIAVILDKV